ncbi:MAG: hypothetical protein V3U16_02425 [Candidatus Neomarinimicrobiota bacterium]
MVIIIIYQIIFLLLLTGAYFIEQIISLPNWFVSNVLFYKCSIIGGIGGVLYCIRAVYHHKSVHEDWDSRWYVWYFLRPIASLISGLFSCIFLNAGLLVLSATSTDVSVAYGFYALAFIAGYNVDNFLKKIESIALSKWSIKKSRAGRNKH